MRRVPDLVNQRYANFAPGGIAEACLEEAPSAEDSTSRVRDPAPRGTARGDSAPDRFGDRAGSAPLPLGQLRRTATPGQQSLAVALDHAGALPAPGLEDRRQLDPAGDHVLNRSHARAVPG